MTFTNGGGFVQANTQIVAEEFTSSNFSNANGTGFDLNSGNSTDAEGTPANTVQIYTNFIVGPPTGNHLALAYGGGQAQLELFSGDAAETLHGSVYVDDSNPGRPSLNLFPPELANGFEQLSLEAATTSDPARLSLVTSGETIPTGWAVKGYINAGGATTDPWTIAVTNTNSVTARYPGLVIGDNLTPGNRLLASTNEIFAKNGAGTAQTLYLNETSTEAAAGSVANILMRNSAARDATAHPTLTSTTFINLGTATVTMTVPQSGILQIWYKGNLTTGVASQTFWLDVIVRNTTQATTPYAGSQNNAAAWSGIVAAGGGTTITGGVSLSGHLVVGGPGGQGSPIGNLGDTVTVHIAYSVTGGTWTMGDLFVSCTPSL